MSAKPQYPLFMTGFGDLAAQNAFLQKHHQFMEEWPTLSELIKSVFLNRTIQPPANDVVSRLIHLPQDHPDVLAVEDKYKADLIVYTLGRIAVDDFSELIVLAANAYGFGSLKILRGMYERVVTAAYIAEHPEASRAFASSVWTHRAKMLRRITDLNPAASASIAEQLRQEILAEARRVQDAKGESICKRCGQIRVVDAWTALDLASMAKSLGPQLENLYSVCYLEATAHMHATGAGVASRMEEIDGAWIYKFDTSSEATMSLIGGHNVILENLRTQNDYFGYGLDQEIGARFAAFPSIWGTA
jgi:Family of unknown function (DUF5677)